MSKKNKTNKKNKCKLKAGQKITFQKVMDGERKALIIENVQNCFFNNGAMGFQSSVKEEYEFINKINYLINLEELRDEQYIKAGQSGKKSKKLLSGIMGKSYFDTEARKKYYYDFIIFSCVTNMPDSYNFASHHYLRNNDEYKSYVSPATRFKNIFHTPESYDKHMKGVNKIILTPDHAITDGSDYYLKGNDKIRGIELHKDINKDCLYRPFSDLHNSAFINKSFYNNRGFILNKGTQNTFALSSFKNSNDKTTGLMKFLKCNNINDITICGIGKENYILDTIKHSKDNKQIKNTFVVIDACKSIGLEVDSNIIKKKIKKDMNSKDYTDKNSYVKLLKKMGGQIVTIDVLMEITQTEQLYKNSSTPTNVKSGLQGLGSLFKQSKKVNMKNKLFTNKKNKGVFSF